MEEKKLELRMYCLVLRQLSGINKGIQGAHALLEYAHEYDRTPYYKDYIENHKTLIMLDGGTSEDMGNILKQLHINGIQHALFREPDLGNLITAICFLVDEKGYDRETYPDFQKYLDEDLTRSILIDKSYQEWVEVIGEKNVIKREILQGKRLSI